MYALLVVIIISTDSYTFIPHAYAYNESPEAISREVVDVRTFRGVKFFFSIQPQTARLNPSYGYLIFSSTPDSGKVIELALALDSCPRGPDKQILFFFFPVEY